ncbi:zinc ABC transporter substrate-binding protein [Notoacmeibacter ruber]|uniref:High-affinity zinc uptake system protein ZnuA n=1 Tax=Notoacmeibacter ruber TaxID=2670375 RepID=A0A3L7JD86_9HYPH|nr:zinc ABC transporter substrate-binding protein [Notoacmeibacter ruber]RLQ88424.1 zinc ABC transporter substrate-binding protein [Notoacmeibacter ruber]
MSFHRLFQTVAPAALISLSFIPTGSARADEAPEVIASFTPIHSLTASLMEGVGEPQLLVPPTGSPHEFALRPSQAGALQDADLVIRIGPALESFLDKPLASLGANAHILDLMTVDGIDLLPTREAGIFDEGTEDHDHDHEEAGSDKHDHDDAHAESADHHEHEHDRDGESHEDHQHENHAHDGHDHGPEDPHIWLDPHNAETMVKAIADELREIDPANADRYDENEKKTLASIEALNDEIRGILGPVKGGSLIAFHDALQYFEKAYGLNVAGTLTISPEIAPGAKRLSALHAKMEEENVRCILVEPQFSPRLAQTVSEGTETKIATFDPAGSTVEPGPQAYSETMLANARALAECLSDN